MILENVRVAYQDRVVLDIPYLAIPQKGITVILGPNGAGKSTLLKVIAGVVPTEGNLQELPESRTYLPQKPYMFCMSVLENVLIALPKQKQDKTRAMKALKLLKMEDFAEKNARTLSGGEAQRVALARTLVSAPEFTLLDEPSSAADVGGALLIENCLRETADSGVGILMTTHNPAQAIRIADWAIMLWDGKLIEQGTPRELLNNPKTPQAEKYAQQWKT